MLTKRKYLNSSINSRLLKEIVLTILLVAASTIVNADTGNTASEPLDLDPPELSHIPGTGQLNGTMPVFSVVATDKQGLANVTLLHRAAGMPDYASVQMKALPGSNQYLATIAKPAADVSIEYYFLATDIGGNRVLNGVPYQPHSVFYKHFDLPGDSPVTETALKDPIDHRLKWTLVGALAVAVLLGATKSSGSPGSSTGSGSETTTVPVIVTFPTP